MQPTPTRFTFQLCGDIDELNRQYQSDSGRAEDRLAFTENDIRAGLESGAFPGISTYEEFCKYWPSCLPGKGFVDLPTDAVVLTDDQQERSKAVTAFVAAHPGRFNFAPRDLAIAQRLTMDIKPAAPAVGMKMGAPGSKPKMKPQNKPFAEE